MLAVVDLRLPETIRSSLVSRGFEIVSLPPNPRLPSPVSSHPDMLLFCAMGRLIVHKHYYALAKEKIDRIARAGDFELILSDEWIGSEYPSDVLFNVAVAGRHVLGKKDCISHHITKICDDFRLNFIDTRQGYAKCSTCVVSHDAIITSDRGVAASARGAGLDVLMIRPGHIRLDGYDTGFIGGASGLCRDNVFFCGSLEKHPDGMSITAFCAAHGKRAVSLSNGELFDAGTLFFF